MKYQKFLGDEKATTQLGVGETIALADYCSIRVYVETRLTCDQDKDIIAQVQAALRPDVFHQLDVALQDGVQLLREHQEIFNG